MQVIQVLCAALLFFTFQSSVIAQVKQRCATMEVLEEDFKNHPASKIKFENHKTQIRQKVAFKLQAPYKVFSSSSVTIPVVFHVVAQNPSLVTDQQISAQLEALNKAFSGTNKDSVKIPEHFKSLFGKSSIQFCLAKRTPDGNPSEGIIRYQTTRSAFTTNNDVKHQNKGGADSWNTEKYLNVWLCKLANGILGYATFPGYGASEEQGIVIDYSTLPQGTDDEFGKGKTLVHEAGHYFDLFHIWGDDDGACSGSDDVDDTPNQANSSQGCPSGVKNDACNRSATGILYQDYMDYSEDDCLLLFTKGQVLRMETSLTEYRSSLIASDGCLPVVVRELDAQLKSIAEPESWLCASTFYPKVIIFNKGKQTINSLVIKATIGDQTSTFHYSKSLAYNQADTVTLSAMRAGVGKQTLTVFVANPNNKTDEDASNDTLTMQVEYYEPVTALKESFEGAVFPPVGWHVINPDNSYTWERTNDAAKTGSHSVVIKNFGYAENDKKDFLRLPVVNISNLDSAYLSFQVAAAVQSPLNVPGNVWDTLEVYISTDCGKTYKSLYKKWGSALITRQTPLQEPFIPGKNEWRKDSVNLSPYIKDGNVLLVFVNTTEFENNIFIDDVNIRRVSLEENLKAAGFLVTPSPTSGTINLDFYPQPEKLVGIVIYNSAGQAIRKLTIKEGTASNHYSFNLTNQAAGIYYAKAIFSDRVLVKKFMKR